MNENSAAAEHIDRATSQRYFSQVYDQLKKIALSRLNHESDDITLQPTALVHEAYLRMHGRDWESTRHFYSVAAEAMRRILIDHARSKNCIKRGRGHFRTERNWESIPDEVAVSETPLFDALLNRLAAQHPEKAEVVKLRFFAGLTIAETAHTLELSTATIERHWRFARAWLLREWKRREQGEAVSV